MAQTFQGGFNDKFLPQVVSGPYIKHYNTTGLNLKMPQTTKASTHNIGFDLNSNLYSYGKQMISDYHVKKSGKDHDGQKKLIT